MMHRFIPPTVEALRPGAAIDAENELNKIREGGFAEGYALGMREGRLAGVREGEARAREEAQAELAALREKFAKQNAISRLAEGIETLIAAREETDRALEDAARTAMTAALRMLFPALLAHAAGEEVLAVVRDALVVRAPEALHLRTHPDTLAFLTSRDLPDLATGRLSLSPDAALEQGAAVVTWSGGGLTFDPAALLERVVAVLSPISAGTEDVRHE